VVYRGGVSPEGWKTEGVSVGSCRGHGPQQGKILFGGPVNVVAGSQIRLMERGGRWGEDMWVWVCWINLDMVGLRYLWAK
jgi:hypothetical protein